LPWLKHKGGEPREQAIGQHMEGKASALRRKNEIWYQNHDWEARVEREPSHRTGGRPALIIGNVIRGRLRQGAIYKQQRGRKKI